MKLVTLLFCILIVLLLTPWLAIWNPKQSISPGAEAVLVFAGGTGERLDLGLELVKTHNVKYMFLSVGAVNWTDQQRLLEYCSTTQESYTVYCIKTNLDSDNTLGEAKLFVEKANELGLNHLVAVSGISHCYRASLRVSQLFDGVVDRIGAADKPAFRALLREWLGIIHAQLTR